MNVLNFRSAPFFQRNAVLVIPLVGALVGLAGPFDSYGTMPLVARMGHFAICALAIGSLAMAASYYTARRCFQGYWPMWAAICLDVILAVPGAAIVYVSLLLLAPDSAAHVHWYDLLWQNLLMMLAFRLGSLFVSWRRVRDGASSRERLDGLVQPNALTQKMPYGLRGEPILALSSEDHYLRVHTPLGEALIHMTLAAAVAMAADGYRIHRSHWVARAGIKEVRGHAVHLVTGLSLPVSRNRAREFRLWLDNPILLERVATGFTAVT